MLRSRLQPAAQCSDANRLSILYVSYPLLTVTPESAGGAEQMLLAVEREMAAAGHRTTVAACDGSQVNGQLLATGPPADGHDQYEQREREHSDCILDYLRPTSARVRPDPRQERQLLPPRRECPVPVLATLHLPRSFYREDRFRRSAARICTSTVSRNRRRRASPTCRTCSESCRTASLLRISRSPPRKATTCSGSVGSARRKLRTWRSRPHNQRRCRWCSRDRSIPSAITRTTSSVRFGRT